MFVGGRVAFHRLRPHDDIAGAILKEEEIFRGALLWGEAIFPVTYKALGGRFGCFLFFLLGGGEGGVRGDGGGGVSVFY